MSESIFRGWAGISEVLSRVNVLADHYEEFRKDCHQITLTRKDLDLIARWPKAAEALKVTVNGGGHFLSRLSASPRQNPSALSTA